MDDKEKIAMLESEKIRLMNKINGYEELMIKLLSAAQMVSSQNDTLMELMSRSDKLLQRNLIFMDDIPRQYRIALFLGILIGISLLDLLLSFLQK